MIRGRSRGSRPDRGQYPIWLPASAGRPTLIRANTQLHFGGMGRLSEHSVVNIKNKSHSVIAEIVSPDRVNGLIIAQGGAFGGWTLYAKDDKLECCDNVMGLRHCYVESAGEITDHGSDTGSAVTPDYTSHGSVFAGNVHWVQIDLGADAADAHYVVSHEERLRVAMARQ